jgi:hypothetical protein
VFRKRSAKIRTKREEEPIPRPVRGGACRQGVSANPFAFMLYEPVGKSSFCRDFRDMCLSQRFWRRRVFLGIIFLRTNVAISISD